MADLVRGIVEASLPELNEWHQRGLFSYAETSQIINKRTDFEYRLARRSRDKADYLNYLQFERQVMDLFNIRASRRRLKITTLLYRFTFTRIKSIYDRALHAYTNDLDLWHQYVEFCKSCKQFHVVAQIYSRAIRLHPTEPSFWISAADHEYRHNTKIDAARGLMQRALRIIKDSQELWLAYFQLELDYLKSIRDRLSLKDKTDKRKKRQQLQRQGEESDVVATGGKGSSSTSVIVATLAEEQEQTNATDYQAEGDPSNSNNNNNDNNNNSTDGAKKQLLSNSPFFRGAVLEAVFQNAIKAIPDDYDFRFEFARICQSYRYLKGLAIKVLETIQRDFYLNSGCLKSLALYNLFGTTKEQPPLFVNDASYHQTIKKQKKRAKTQKQENSQKGSNNNKKAGNGSDDEVAAVSAQSVTRSLFDRAQHRSFLVFDNAIKVAKESSPSTIPAIVESYVEFGRYLLSYYNMHEQLCAMIENHIRNVLTEANETKQLTPNSFAYWIELESDQPDRALQVATLGTEQYPSDATVWLQRLETHRLQNPSPTDETIALFNQALKQVKGAGSVSLWRLYLDWVVPATNPEFDDLMKYYKSTVLPSADAVELRGDFLERVNRLFGLAPARQVYTFTLQVPPVTVSYYRKCLEIEREAFAPDWNKIRFLFDRAVEHFSEDTGLWNDYILFETEQKEWEKLSLLHFRMKKALQAPFTPETSAAFNKAAGSKEEAKKGVKRKK